MTGLSRQFRQILECYLPDLNVVFSNLFSYITTSFSFITLKYESVNQLVSKYQSKMMYLSFAFYLIVCLVPTALGNESDDQSSDLSLDESFESTRSFVPDAPYHRLTLNTSGNSKPASKSSGQAAQDRIVNGQDASISDAPWLCSLQIFGKSESESSASHHLFCAGSILDPRSIVTAAHCCKYIQSQVGFWVSAVCGATRWATEGTRYNITNNAANVIIIKKPAYNSARIRNDIGMLHVERPIQFNSLVQPACLPSAGQTSKGSQMYVAGWGLTNSTDQSLPPSLMAINLTWLEPAGCSAVYSIYDGKTQICAAPPTTASSILTPGGTCNGDSGGGLVNLASGRSACRAVLYGIVSYGDSTCATPGNTSPSVFTLVSAYIDFISQNLSPKT